MEKRWSFLSYWPHLQPVLTCDEVSGSWHLILELCLLHLVYKCILIIGSYSQYASKSGASWWFCHLIWCKSRKAMPQMDIINESFLREDLAAMFQLAECSRNRQRRLFSQGCVWAVFTAFTPDWDLITVKAWAPLNVSWFIWLHTSPTVFCVHLHPFFPLLKVSRYRSHLSARCKGGICYSWRRSYKSRS